MLHGILDVKEKVYIDDSITSFEYVEKDTDQGTTNLNSLTETTITYNGQNTWMCPGKSYLIIEGTIQINAAPPVAWADANGTALAFINNGLMYMFSNARYYMNGHQIEYFDWVGLTTSMNNYLTKSRNYDGLTWMWAPDRYIDLANLKNRGFALRNLKIRPFNGDHAPAAGAPNYSFSCQLPLDAIFNFCHDYKKVMLGIEHKISFTRGSSNVCFIRNSAAAVNAGAVGAVSEFPSLSSTLNNATAGGTAGDAIVLLTKFRWAMPYVIPNSIQMIELKSMLENQEPQMITYRNKRSTLISVTAGSTVFNWTPRLISGSVERPRYIVCGFIVNRYNVANSQEVALNTAAGGNIGNAGTFSPGYQVNLTDAYITVDNIRYPYATTQTNFNAGQYDKFYRFYTNFYHDFHGDCSTSPCIPYEDFIAFNTPYVFDVSKQPTPVNNSTTDITLNFTFGTGVPANTYVFVMVYFDSKFTITGENGDRQVIQLVGDTK